LILPSHLATMKQGLGFFYQLALTLFGVALLPTLGTSRPVLIACWTFAALGLLAFGISLYRAQRRPLIALSAESTTTLRRHLLHLLGELETLDKTAAQALASERWWDVRFSGLPAHEWHAARDVIAASAPQLYSQFVPLYVEADQLNKAANTAAARRGPGRRLNAESKEGLESFHSDALAAITAVRKHTIANEQPPRLKHPYRTLAVAVAITAGATATTALFAPSLWSADPRKPIYVSNPLPRDGFPHGTGISHRDYPDGFQINGVPTPTFNSYIDNEDGSRLDERAFLAARVTQPLRVPASGLKIGLLYVRPGDTVEISIYIRNDADPAGNGSGRGRPAIARNTRVLSGWNRKKATVLSVGAYIFAENAAPDVVHPDLKTISANLELRSQTEQPIEFEYVPNSAQYLQNASSFGQRIPGRKGTYKVWRLNAAQQRMLFTGFRRKEHANTEIDAASGLPLGSDGSYWRQTLLGRHINDRKRFYGGSGYFGYLVYRAQVISAT
jgi:hypothetical protein